MTMVGSVLVPQEISAYAANAERSVLIDGTRREAVGGETIENFDPGTGQVIGQLARGGAEDVDLAVQSAFRAFDQLWRDLKPSARARCLFTLADLMDAHAEELASLETLDNGKPITESRYVDVALASEVFRYYGGWATKYAGEVLAVSPTVGSAFAYTRYEPLGVVGAIVPWNFPLLLLSWKLGPALATGNSVVVKPSELTSLSTLYLAELALEAGIPPGVVNVVTGFGPEAGQALTEHPLVAKVTFTGSTETGKKVLAASVGSLKQVTLELGGKSPNIVFADADLDAAVQGAFLGIFMNQGQVCCAGSRAFVEESIYDVFVDRLANAATGINLGHGMAEGTDMGPLVSATQKERVMRYVTLGQDEGATLVCGGDTPNESAVGKGYFVKPTIFSDVKDEMTIAREEIFGPVLAVLPFRGEDEVISRANASQYGLAAGVWTQDLRRAHTVAAALEAGTVWVNSYNMIDPTTPFGGYKDSGFGRDLGVDGLRSYTRTKSVWIGLD